MVVLIKEAKIKYCFENTNANELRCAFYSNNLSSKRMQEKAGMIIEDSVYKNNQVITKINRNSNKIKY